MSDLRFSLLDAEHRALGARMVPFGGWEMPLQYTSVLEEHRACRESAVVFDVSHLGGIRVTGELLCAADALQKLFTNDLHKAGPGDSQYTHFLDDGDAHVIDDIIVWALWGDDFLVIPNAANTAPTVRAIRESVVSTPGSATVREVTSERAFLALQGPQARDVLVTVMPDAKDKNIGRNHVDQVWYLGEETLVGGTGYTGEDGVEIYAPPAVAAELWRELVGAGVTPAGLGARDTLRLEMGYPLHGHELGPGITPLQAGLGWVVAWDKESFRGKAALLAERERGVSRRLRGIVMEGRQVPRDGYTVLVDGEPVGTISSGNFSPTLERGIALAFLRPDVAVDTPVEIDIRGKPTPGTVTKPPFVDAHFS